MDHENIWITGGNTQIVYRKHIGSGGAGDVHELISTLTGKLFARKIIRISGPVEKQDVENEARVVSLLHTQGGHGNLVSILGHDWLKFSYNCYYIDMELCDFSLYDYIKYHNAPTGTPEINVVPILSPAVVQKGCPVAERMKNIFTIVIHIARGLEFMHTQISHAHRDLKPGNVLYSRPDNRWKLTDFGISAEATSRKAHTTLYSKGTSSYRTPELLGEHAAFTNKVDIWALGCILHELATGKYAFHEDWAVREYFLKGEDLFIPLSASNGFFKNLIYGAVNDLLSRDWNQRPAASSVCLMFLACSRLLDLPIMYALNASRSYPSYAEWKGLVENHPNELDFLSELATLYERIGEASLAVALQQAADSRTNWGQERTWSEGPGDSIVKAELISEKAGDGGALKLLETAVQLDADNFWSWHNLCDAYVGMGDCDAAIRVCNQEITRFPSNPWPVLALANAYAVKGEYHEAISVHMKFFVGRLSGGGHRRSETAIFDRLVSQQPHGMIVVPIEMVETKRDYKNGRALKSWLSAKAVEWVGRNPGEKDLHFAAWTGDSTLLKEILPRELERIRLNIQSTNSYTPLHLAVWNMHSDAVRLLLGITNPWLLSGSSPGGWTPFHFAAWNNDVGIMENLLQAGAMTDPQDSDGWTPLHFAANRGHLEGVRLLINAGANVSMGGRDGLTPLHRAAAYGHVDVIRTLIRSGGANPSARSDNRSCPLHWAAVGGRTAAITTLIEEGADISAKEKYGWVPLHRAATFGHVEAVKALLEAKADISTPSDTGATPLHWAAERGQVSVVLVLLNAGADVSVRENNGWTPMHRAATFGHGEVITILANAGADVSSRDNDGRTPMEWALRLGHVNAINALREAEALEW